MLQALINLFSFKKEEPKVEECPYKVEAPESKPVEVAPKAVAEKPAKKKPAAKNTKAKPARNKKKNA